MARRVESKRCVPFSPLPGSNHANVLTVFLRCAQEFVTKGGTFSFIRKLANSVAQVRHAMLVAVRMRIRLQPYNPRPNYLAPQKRRRDGHHVHHHTSFERNEL